MKVNCLRCLQKCRKRQSVSTLWRNGCKDPRNSETIWCRRSVAINRKRKIRSFRSNGKISGFF